MKELAWKSVILPREVTLAVPRIRREHELLTGTCQPRRPEVSGSKAEAGSPTQRGPQIKMESGQTSDQCDDGSRGSERGRGKATGSQALVQQQ